MATASEHHLDKILLPYGLTASDYPGSGRQYQGHIGSRSIHIYTRSITTGKRSDSPGRYSGHSVEIYLDSSLHTRAQLNAQSSGLSGMLNRAPQNLDTTAVPYLENKGLLFTALDRQWGTALAESTQELLAATAEQPGFRFLRFQPEALHLAAQLHWQEITTEKLDFWISALTSLASHAETLEPAQVTASESKQERNMRLARGSTLKRLRFFGVTVGLSIVLIVMIIFRSL